MDNDWQRELPDEFWEALLQVRDYLMRDKTFTELIYGPTNRREDLRQSFDIVDNWLNVRIESCGF